MTLRELEYQETTLKFLATNFLISAIKTIGIKENTKQNSNAVEANFPDGSKQIT